MPVEVVETAAVSGTFRGGYGNSATMLKALSMVLKAITAALEKRLASHGNFDEKKTFFILSLSLSLHSLFTWLVAFRNSIAFYLIT